MHIQYFMVLIYVKYYLILFGTNEYGLAKAMDRLDSPCTIKDRASTESNSLRIVSL
jgi:hypothetical protein